jgi:hypothetical protein
MNNQPQSVFTISEAPKSIETGLQEISCVPALDLSLPADVVLTQRMHDQGPRSLPPVFVP